MEPFLVLGVGGGVFGWRERAEGGVTWLCPAVAIRLENCSNGQSFMATMSLPWFSLYVRVG